MHTPSLARRVTVAGVVVLALLLLAFDLAVYLGVRSELEGNLREVLDTRLDIARGLVDEVDPGGLADRLTALGVPASIAAPDGEVIDADPAVPRFGSDGIPSTLPAPRVRASETMGELEVTVYATRAGVDQALRRLATTEIVATATAMVLALVLLRRSTSVALRPLEEVVGTAVRTAAGARGERLHPEQPDTELGRLATAFDAMLDELEQALAASTASDERTQRFLADAAHQLRTPIAGIRASVESLVREDDEGMRDRLVGNLVRETSRSARLLSDLLLVARLDAGEPGAPRTEVDLGALCGEEAERARDLAPHLAVTWHPPADPVVAVADTTELRGALGNLLDNARRHAAAAIEVALTGDDATATIVVRDDGPGLDPAVVDAAFERFASLDGRGGSGLGLPIARAVARAHAGDLTWRDGAFVLELPRIGRQAG